MEKILVFSDLHGDKHSLKLLINIIEKEDVDLVLSAGDLVINYLSRSFLELTNLRVPFKYVRGNCDMPYHFRRQALPVAPIHLTVEFDNRILFLTHGHYFYDWKFLPITLSKRDIFISGHTHVSSVEQKRNSPVLLNPGSVTYPRDNNGPTYATIDKQKIETKSLVDSKVLKELKFTN